MDGPIGSSDDCVKTVSGRAPARWAQRRLDGVLDGTDKCFDRNEWVSEIILHHYPQSPMAEKARLALGFKRLNWRSVEVPRLPPKPDLMPLTGGYRRVPVMQVGADIYCDTQCITRELERRHHVPSFFPGQSHGVASALSRWSDSSLFEQAVHIVIGSGLETMPADWIRDRTGLMFGPEMDPKDLQADIPHIAAQMRAQLGWINGCLEDQAFILGEKPSLPDLALYPLIWALRARWTQGPEMFSRLEALEAWETRVAAIGHGRAQNMVATEALEVARKSEITTPEQDDPYDTQGIIPGMEVAVRPMGSGKEPGVTGIVRCVGADDIAVLHEGEQVGTICIHFPRAGYRVSPA